MSNTFSLTPGFSPVRANEAGQNRFNGFSPRRQAVETARPPAPFTTRLKPGVNGNRCFIFANLYRTQK
jgi:hypothetical protein